jgi:hypothetical protein
MTVHRAEIEGCWKYNAAADDSRVIHSYGEPLSTKALY